ncbi:hypothetical protein [Roseococcus suduntuyensis]|uniref:Uncharacterized protein n=1 Tax=Roseococcus suduntuyensis TaxID=455361 RepID=A0A840AG98_9PROT|nr:hypothetical protein [Roseococcus suduntuyensis]MBB3900111.1 hypothetical protein [Roseococcus suduntuyensis]
MKVYRSENGENRLLGRAEIPDDGRPVFEVHLFGAASTITDQFTIGTVSVTGPGRSEIRVERAVLLAPFQRPEILPGWEPLAS